MGEIAGSANRQLEVHPPSNDRDRMWWGGQSEARDVPAQPIGTHG